MTTRVIPKLEVQSMLREMRKDSSLNVKKIKGMYKVVNEKNEEIFTALNGRKGYLCKWNDEFLKVKFK